MTCDEARDLAPAYVLGALERDEEQTVRGHLATCPHAHEEFAELGSVVPALDVPIELVEPPASLRDRIMAAAAVDLAERRSAPSSMAAAAVDLAERRSAPSSMAAAAVDLAERRSAPPSIAPARAGLGRPRFAWAIGIAAVLAIVALGAWNVALRAQLDSATAYRQAVGQVLAAAAAPGSHTAVLSSRDNPGRAGLAAIAADGSVHVVMHGLAPTTGGHVYEAWVIAGSAAPTPIGSFTVGPDGTGSLTGAGPGAAGVTVALTLEPGPGATTPTLPIVSSGVAGSSS
ncbi:MAG: anti-sigma factor [Chloroflexi bacterium]|nr:anti-sigma factor [Chloroflexota bacterium]